jgi:hypothetical protein
MAQVRDPRLVVAAGASMVGQRHEDRGQITGH